MAVYQVVIFVLIVVVSVTALPTAPYGQVVPSYGQAGPSYGQASQSSYGHAGQSSYGHAGPAYGPAYNEGPYEERNYKVYYSVKDDPSYNYQTRNEEKNGNTVTGQYTVLEPTGELRVVNYIADDYGFRADVKNQAGYGPSYPVKVSAPGYGGSAPY